MDTNYKEVHKEAISNQTGSSLIEVFSSLFPLPVHLVIFVWISVGVNYSTKMNSPTIWMFLLEFITMVLPTVFNFTLFSEHPNIQFIVYLILLAFPFTWLLLNRNYMSSNSIKTKKNPYITIYRFLLNTYTVFCILAVDFNVFPRRFAKTEKYGHSVMDIGVGCYVCSYALLFRIPKINNLPKYVFEVFKEVFPILMIGIGRTFFITITDYHHYVFEYGVHWNFFMTLACLQIINLLVLPCISVCWLPGCATILIVIYETVLNFGLADWIMSDAPRDTLFSANREGILSLIGYEAIFLYTLSLKWHLSVFMKKNHLINSMFLLVIVFFLSILLFLLTSVISYFFGVSRRLANAGYVYWTLSITSFLLFMGIMIENLITVLLNKKHQSNEFYKISLVIDCVNDNLLFFFLFANVLTGIINMCMYTFLMNTVSSLSILSLYMFVIYFTFYKLQNFKNKVK